MYAALKTLNPNIFKMLLDAGFDPNTQFSSVRGPIRYLAEREKYDADPRDPLGLNPEKVLACIEQFLNRNTRWVVLIKSRDSDQLTYHPFDYLLYWEWDDHDDLREAVLQEIQQQGYSLSSPFFDHLIFDLAVDSHYSCKVLRWVLGHGASTEVEMAGYCGANDPPVKPLRQLIKQLRLYNEQGIYSNYQTRASSKTPARSNGCNSPYQYAHKALALLEAGADCLEVTGTSPTHPTSLPVLIWILTKLHNLDWSDSRVDIAHFIRLRHQALQQLKEKGIDLNSLQIHGKSFLSYLEDNQEQFSDDTFILLFCHGLQLSNDIRISPLNEIKETLKRKHTASLELMSLHEALKPVTDWKTLYLLPPPAKIIRARINELFQEETE
jgi:hypothetical protein